jgi:virginiamycin B lyase
VWFSELTDGTLGRLDPATGHIQLYQVPTRDAQLFSLTAAPDGSLWFSELQYGRIGRLDPASGAIQEFTVPATFSTTPNVYDLAVTHDGTVWVAAMGQNAIARFVPAIKTFTLYTLPDANSLPYGLVLDDAGRVWFTAERSPTNYVGLLDPSK